MKIGVIGVGVMGGKHVRVLRNIPEVDEIIIADSDEDNLLIVSKRYGIVENYSDYRQLIETGKPDGVIIATQPSTHKEIAIFAMKAGIPVLVEKPIAHSLEDAQQMIDCAKNLGAIFTVGHIERFNPVVTKIKEFIDQKLLSNIYLVNTHRIGPFPKRLFGKSEGVLVDLAVHDLDIISHLCGDIVGVRSNIIRTNLQEIYVMALLDINNNVKGSAEFSWISPRMSRNIEIYGDEGMISGDYSNQEVWFFENDDYDNNTKEVDPRFLNGLVKSGKTIKFPIFKQEPLLVELDNFVKSILGTEKPLVSPHEAFTALKNSIAISDQFN